MEMVSVVPEGRRLIGRSKGEGEPEVLQDMHSGKQHHQPHGYSTSSRCESPNPHS